MSAPILAFALIPLMANWHDASRAKETATREWAHDLLNSVEPYGILVTLGDNDTFPLWYAQEVEGVRRDVTVAVTSLLNTDWYPRGLKTRAIIPYDAAHGPAPYRALASAPPTRPVFTVTNAELDAIPDYVDVRTPQVFQQGTLRAVVNPAMLEYGVPTRGDLMVLQLLKDNLGIRPVYIARTSGNYVDALGLTPYAVVQGLATKITTAPVSSSAALIPVEGVGHVDVPRTRELWNGYGAPAAIMRRGDWIDRPSVGIPVMYAITAFLLAEVSLQQGDTAHAEKMRKSALDIAESVRMTELFAPRATAPPAQDTKSGRAVPLPP